MARLFLDSSDSKGTPAYLSLGGIMNFSISASRLPFKSKNNFEDRKIIEK